MDKNYTLQTVDRALSFLETVADAPSPPSIRDVSAKLDLNITTCYHLLRTLTARKYVKRLENGGLELGEGVARLARSYRRPESREQMLSEIVHRLSSVTLETAFLSLREGANVVLKVLVEGSHRLRVAGLYVGLTGHEHRRAAGKAVLAHLGAKERTAMLQGSLAVMPARQRTAILKSLDKELPLTVARGWSVDDGQTEHGIISVGAPIFDDAGEVIGAVGIVMPTFRMDKAPEAMREYVLQAAADANRLLRDLAAV